MFTYFPIPVLSSPPADRHEESLHMEDEVSARTRVRVPTQKGKEFAISRLTSALQSAKRSWRRQLNHLQLQIITRSEIPALQRDCELLEERMWELFKAQEALEEVLESKEEKKELDGNLEKVARENNSTLRQVGERIKDLEMALLERNSTRSTSTRRSSNSKRSHSSQKAGKDSVFSTQRRICLEEDIATLKATIALTQERQAIETQSKRMLEEIEQRKKDVLQEEERALEEIRKLNGSFKLKEELAKKEAIVNAYAKIEQEERASQVARDELNLPPDDGKGDQMERFLRDLPEFKPPLPPMPSPISAAAKSLSLDPSSPVFVPLCIPTLTSAPATVTW